MLAGLPGTGQETALRLVPAAWAEEDASRPDTLDDLVAIKAYVLASRAVLGMGDRDAADQELDQAESILYATDRELGPAGDAAAEGIDTIKEELFELPPEELRLNYASALRGIDRAAEDMAPGWSTDPRRGLEVGLGLMRRAAAEYAASMGEGGETDAIVYIGSRGLFTLARQVLGGVERDLAARDGAAWAMMQRELEGLEGLAAGRHTAPHAARRPRSRAAIERIEAAGTRLL